MFLIDCPWCGARDEVEFSCAGEANIVRPHAPEGLDDDAWADYVFMRRNTRGKHLEMWVHSAGCRRFFNVQRHTVTNEIIAIEEIRRGSLMRRRVSWFRPD